MEGGASTFQRRLPPPRAMRGLLVTRLAKAIAIHHYGCTVPPI
jgi:hypothetical protein